MAVPAGKMCDTCKVKQASSTISRQWNTELWSRNLSNQDPWIIPITLGWSTRAGGDAGRTRRLTLAGGAVGMTNKGLFAERSLGCCLSCQCPLHPCPATVLFTRVLPLSSLVGSLPVSCQWPLYQCLAVVLFRRVFTRVLPVTSLPVSCRCPL